MGTLRGYSTSFKDDADKCQDVTVQHVGSNRYGLDVSTSQKSEAIRLDDVGGGVTYVGWAEPGTLTSTSTWKIMRMTEASSDITIEWADGNILYDNIWDNRAALSYS